MSVTLERIGDYLHIHGDANGAALVRAAAEVVKRANVVKDAAERGLFAMSPPAETYFGEMCDALDAFDAISQGAANE